jgi:hypothetical protein
MQLMNRITPSDLRQEAKKFESAVGSALADAAALLESSEAQSVEYANFTAVHPALASVYAEALHFFSRDIASKRETALEYRTRLETTADNWQEAEDSSNVALSRKVDL